ncbi:LpxI family protein [Meridianimarinicoccus sp. RP-17]|uniref:LpxI family protein n=1 Tax=Meridianimarinicoccus zhengii TaxID=2056810 RepID=UPI0013A6C9F6|nr:UDP-2,3-diacylglucosamine diphosphatase LpxI [Phycocomes zhengii]
MTGPVGIVAGRGALPVALARALAGRGRDVVLAEMAGFPVDNPDDLPVIPFRVEKLGALFKTLRAAGVREVAFAGAVARPRLDPAQFDFRTLTLAPRILASLKGGDDATLRMVLDIFEGEGFAVRAAHDIAPDLLPSAGVLTRAQPGSRDRKDASRAAAIVAALSAVDVGQGAVVAGGLALGVEALPGTDRMLAQVAALPADLRPDPASARGVLFKGPKIGQDRRIDLPVIGPDTVAGAAAAGLSGIAIAAGGVMVLDRPAVIAAADAAGLFLWVRKEGEP